MLLPSLLSYQRLEANSNKLYQYLAETEVADGKAALLPLAEASAGVLTPRFPVDEGWRKKDDGWIRKVRCIDDFAASLVSLCAQAKDKLHNGTLDSLLALVRMYRHLRLPLRLRKADFVKAC